MRIAVAFEAVGEPPVVDATGAILVEEGNGFAGGEFGATGDALAFAADGEVELGLEKRGHGLLREMGLWFLLRPPLSARAVPFSPRDGVGGFVIHLWRYNEDLALVEFVESGLEVGREGRVKFVGVTNGPIAVLVGGDIGVEVLGEDVGGAEGFDEGFGGGDVSVVKGGRDEEDVDVVQIFELFLEENGVAGLVDFLVVEGEDVATVVGVGTAVDGKVCVAVKGASGFDGDALDGEGFERGGGGDPVLGDADFVGFVGAVGGEDKMAIGLFSEYARSGVAEVIAVFVSDELDVEDGGEVGGGDGGRLDTVVAVEIKVDGEEFVFGANEPAEVSEPAEGGLVLDI